MLVYRDLGWVRLWLAVVVVVMVVCVFGSTHLEYSDVTAALGSDVISVWREGNDANAKRTRRKLGIKIVGNPPVFIVFSISRLNARCY